MTSKHWPWIDGLDLNLDFAHATWAFRLLERQY
jgi:hypothetical protein